MDSACCADLLQLPVQSLYQQEGKRLISVYPRDLSKLDDLLTSKLRHYGFTA